MELEKNSPEELSKKEKAALVMDLMHRLIMHHVMWFDEIKHQMGAEAATDLLWKASEKSIAIQMKRFAKQFNFEMEDNIPVPLINMEDSVLDELMKNISTNWLVNDGVWFQSVEFEKGMIDAKRCNDSCWGQFSPFEASAVKRFLGLSEKCGLPGLKKAFKFRLYSFINEQSFAEEKEDSFILRMDKCRVQAARKRKNLDDYPCKSGGLVEYTYFAKAIDARIETECIACPPDSHPDEWYCSWRFSIKE
jgi:Family of unknown function (DUF6125)